MPDNDNKITLGSILSFTQGIIPLIVAIVILYFFWTQLREMLDLAKANATEPIWSRAAFIYGGVEAIAFAAAGFLFGREVHRQRADKAEKRADNAQAEAGEAKKEATEAKTKGKALAAMVEQKAMGQPTKANEYKSLGVASAEAATQVATKADLDEVAAVAKRLFP